MQRRGFLLSALATPLGLARLRAIEPLRREGPAKLQLSLAAYSYNRYLNLRGQEKPTMTLEQFIDEAAAMKLPAVELTAYYFRDTRDSYIKEIKKRCVDKGLDVSGTAVGNDFCWPDEKRQQMQLDDVKAWTARTALLGGRTLRLFAGSVKKGDSEAKAVQRAISLIQKACDHAADHKVFLALENHGGITATAEQLLALVKPIKSDWFGVNLDTGNFRTANPYADLAKVAPYAVNVQMKTEIFPNGKRQEADLPRLVKLLRDATYQGYVALEYEAAEDPKKAVPRYVETLRKLLA
ncbi:MAG: sugar phosphate isomerase/epimerase family protein [Gemmataceae bacterium]